MATDAISDAGREAIPDAEIVRIAARAHEFDHYLSALLAPRHLRPDLLAVAAFVGEVSRVPAYVSEPMIGEIRLQWWRDALAGQGGLDQAGDEGCEPAGSSSDPGQHSGAESASRNGPDRKTGNPIADAFARTMHVHNLPLGIAQGVIDAQSLALYSAPPRDEMELRQHLAKIHGGAFALVSRIVAADAAGANAAWIRDAGIAYGIARTALETPALLAQGRNPFPEPWLVDAGVSAEQVIHRPTDPVVHTLANRLGDVAIKMLAKLQSQPVRPPSRILRICRPLAMVEPYCAVVRALEFGRHGVVEDVSPLRRAWTLWRGVRRTW